MAFKISIHPTVKLSKSAGFFSFFGRKSGEIQKDLWSQKSFFFTETCSCFCEHDSDVFFEKMHPVFAWSRSYFMLLICIMHRYDQRKSGICLLQRMVKEVNSTVHLKSMAFMWVKARLSQKTSWLQSPAQVRWANCSLDFYVYCRCLMMFSIV